MGFVILVTVLLLVQYLYFAFRAGGARGKGEVKAPAVTGDEHFERCLRIQLNTLEQLAITLPSMWICAVYFRTDVAAILGAIFLLSRFVYSRAYLADPAGRGTGMIIGLLANLGLMLCCLYVAILMIL